MGTGKDKKYDANFTAGGLLFNEFDLLKPILLSDDFNNAIQEEQEKNELIAIKTLGARKRIISEVKRRNNNAPHDFWDHYYLWNEKEQKLALFYLCLKSYPLVLDLQIEVALKKYKTGSSLGTFDVTMRLDKLASENEDLASWSDGTLDKLNSQYRKVIKDAGLFNKGDLNKPIGISSSFWTYFKQINEAWFLEACFSN